MISTVSLIVPSLTLCSTAITFTAQLASDYLSLAHRNTNAEMLTDTCATSFAYHFHLEIVILVIRLTERKHNYGTGFHLVAARLCECICASKCMCVMDDIFTLSKLWSRKTAECTAESNVTPKTQCQGSLLVEDRLDLSN